MAAVHRQLEIRDNGCIPIVRARVIPTKVRMTNSRMKMRIATHALSSVLRETGVRF
jgi:hypothetical protein